MIAEITYGPVRYKIDLSKPLDISIPIQNGQSNVNAWYIADPKIAPHQEGDFIGAVVSGASTNFNDIWFNPHAHGTHTECLGHIADKVHSINKNLRSFFFMAELITVAPGKWKDDMVITRKQLEVALGGKNPEALVIRTLPNTKDKLIRRYSNTNPPYLLEEAASFLKSIGVKHLLIDLPSVDKEKDKGALLAHHAFWNTKDEPRFDATITEFTFVQNSIKDGAYLLNLQVAPFENDASPSRPVLYQILS